jgi:uroporphyrinogen III methyltransferase/synthase
MEKGKVWLVGAGPGDPGLMTLKGKAVLEQAEVVLYDQHMSEGILAMIPQGAKRISTGEISESRPAAQPEINRILVEEALSGKRVVSLKGGDPLVFSWGGEELEELAGYGISFEVVPGVTSALAAPAYAGIPVTHKDYCSSVHIIMGHAKNLERRDIDFPSLVKLGGTLVFLKGESTLPVICKELTNAGMDPEMPAAVLENGTSPGQRQVVSNLRNLAEEAAKADIKPPAVIIVGKVCSLAELFHWTP